MKDYPVIDADGHIYETTIIDWENAIAEPYKRIAPKVITLPNGGKRLLLEGQQWPRHFPSEDKPGATEYSGLHRSREGMWNPKLRLEHLDVDGIDTAVLFGGALMVGASSLRNAGLGAEVARVYNDWVHTFCQANPKRLKGVACVAYQNPEAGGKELDRAVKELGFVGVGIPTNINGLGLDDAFFAPLFEDAQSLDIPMCIGHGMGVAHGIHSVGQERISSRFVIMATNFPLELMLTIAICVSRGLFDKYPKLKFAFLKGWVSWLPFWVERMEEYVESYASHTEMKARPSEYIKGPQFYAGCEPSEEALPEVVEAIGEDHILYASDYWHFDAKFPGSVKTILEKKGLSETAKRKLLYDNASRLYKLSVNGGKAAKATK